MSRKYKSFFPHKINSYLRIDVKDGRIVLEKRGVFLWWKWTEALTLPKVIEDESGNLSLDVWEKGK